MVNLTLSEARGYGRTGTGLRSHVFHEIELQANIHAGLRRETILLIFS